MSSWAKRESCGFACGTYESCGFCPRAERRVGKRASGRAKGGRTSAPAKQWVGEATLKTARERMAKDWARGCRGQRTEAVPREAYEAYIRKAVRKAEESRESRIGKLDRRADAPQGRVCSAASSIDGARSIKAAGILRKGRLAGRVRGSYAGSASGARLAPTTPSTETIPSLRGWRIRGKARAAANAHRRAGRLPRIKREAKGKCRQECVKQRGSKTGVERRNVERM